MARERAEQCCHDVCLVCVLCIRDWFPVLGARNPVQARALKAIKTTKGQIVQQESGRVTSNVTLAILPSRCPLGFLVTKNKYKKKIQMIS